MCEFSNKQFYPPPTHLAEKTFMSPPKNLPLPKNPPPLPQIKQYNYIGFLIESDWTNTCRLNVLAQIGIEITNAIERPAPNP